MDANLPTDGLAAFDYDPRNIQYPHGRVTYPIPFNGDASRRSANANPIKRSTTPLQTQPYQQPLGQLSQQQSQANSYIPDWQLQQPQLGYQFDGTYPSDTTYTQNYLTEGYAMQYQTSPTDYVSPQGQYDPTLAIDGSYGSYGSYGTLAGQFDPGMAFDFQAFSNEVMAPNQLSNGLPDMTLAQQTFPNSPTDTSLEVRSLSSSDNGWIDVPAQSFDGLGTGSYQDPRFNAIFNPEETLHGRTFSDSSNSDIERQSRHSWSSWVDVPQHAIGSPSSDSLGDMDLRDFPRDFASQGSVSPLIKQENQPRPTFPSMTPPVHKPIRIKTSSSPQSSPTSTGRISPPGRRQSRKNPNCRATKPATKRPPPLKAETEKRVGRRKGPLKPEQRKQAGEIRKLGACIRCKFLKKTCDVGDPCEGCQPSHARLWQVPCTRIDIKEIAYFMKDWKADYERHVSLGLSVTNIRGYSNIERTLFITHGYGHMLPVRAREIYVHDERCFGLDWVETIHETPTEHSVNTAKLASAAEGINRKMLDEYLDRHIDGGFEEFVDEYFEGTPFLTQMLKTAYKFWQRERTVVIRKSMKLLLAYNLTQHVTMVEGIPNEEGFLGKINDPMSKFCGRTVAPVMINFQIKCAMADVWRDLQKEILEELSVLYSRVYGKDKLINWPTIFMVASILLAVWEEMQFDCHYRVPDKEVVYKFCNDMEATPVGVIVGLFSAISQKVPSFQEWSTPRHHQRFESNPAVCDAMEEIQKHVSEHDKYLRSRPNASFDRDDFDSLANKFTSKLVIRASAC